MRGGGSGSEVEKRARCQSSGLILHLFRLGEDKHGSEHSEERITSAVKGTTQARIGGKICHGNTEPDYRWTMNIKV